MSCAPFISNTWFPFRDRVLATGIMLLGGNFGEQIDIMLGKTSTIVLISKQS